MSYKMKAGHLLHYQKQNRTAICCYIAIEIMGNLTDEQRIHAIPCKEHGESYAEIAKSSRCCLELLRT